MSREHYLKARNAVAIVAFIAWAMAIYVGFLAYPGEFWERVRTTFVECRAKDGIFIALSPVVVLVLTGLISSENKARLVFWRIHDALPGHRAFSEWARKDPRIDVQALRKKLGDLPAKPKEQNAAWYSIYRKHATALRVQKSHQRFLLARDLCAISFLFAVTGPWSLLLFRHGGLWVLAYFSLMVSHYIVLSVVARNHGNRMVCNVLAEESLAE